MAKLFIKDYPHLLAYGHFEDDQSWPDSIETRKMLEGANHACGRASRAAKYAANQEMYGDKEPLKEARACSRKWAIAANVMLHVIGSMREEEDGHAGNEIMDFLKGLK